MVHTCCCVFRIRTSLPALTRTRAYRNGDNAYRCITSINTSNCKQQKTLAMDNDGKLWAKNTYSIQQRYWSCLADNFFPSQHTINSLRLNVEWVRMWRAMYKIRTWCEHLRTTIFLLLLICFLFWWVLGVLTLTRSDCHSLPSTYLLSASVVCSDCILSSTYAILLASSPFVLLLFMNPTADCRQNKWGADLAI